MNLRNALFGVIVAVAGFLVVGVAVTELAAKEIEFSLFLGLPAGIVGGLVFGWVTTRWLSSDVAEHRHRGAALAGFGVGFLTVVLGLTVVGGMRNSRALPIGAGIGIAIGGLLYGWYRRGDRELPPVDDR
ncbi:MAG: hypothetical protein ABEI76_09780 [Halobacteriales archaeon]